MPSVSCTSWTRQHVEQNGWCSLACSGDSSPASICFIGMLKFKLRGLNTLHEYPVAKIDYSKFQIEISRGTARENFEFLDDIWRVSRLA